MIPSLPCWPRRILRTLSSPSAGVKSWQTSLGPSPPGRMVPLCLKTQKCGSFYPCRVPVVLVAANALVLPCSGMAYLSWRPVPGSVTMSMRQHMNSSPANMWIKVQFPVGAKMSCRLMIKVKTHSARSGHCLEPQLWFAFSFDAGIPETGRDGHQTAPPAGKRFA